MVGAQCDAGLFLFQEGTRVVQKLGPLQGR